MIERKKDRDKLFVHVCLSSFCLIDIWYKRDVYFAPRPRFPASQFDAGNREMSSWPIFIILPAFSYNIRIKVINRRMLLDFLPHFVNGEEEGGFKYFFRPVFGFFAFRRLFTKFGESRQDICLPGSCILSNEMEGKRMRDAEKERIGRAIHIHGIN